MAREFLTDGNATQDSDNRFRSLLNALREGQQDASQTLVAEYGSHILRAVRRRMNRQVRDRFDSEDFAQSVWASFFGNLSVVANFNSSGELAGYLARMASNKVIDAGRKTAVRAERNSQGRDEKLEADRDHRRQFAEPTPSQFAVANEHWQRLTDKETDVHRRLLELRRSGATQQEIASDLGLSERHVRRVLDRLARKSAEAGPPPAVTDQRPQMNGNTAHTGGS